MPQNIKKNQFIYSSIDSLKIFVVYVLPFLALSCLFQDSIIAQTGIITTVAGNGERGFSGDGDFATNAKFDFPNGVFVDSEGNVFIADRFNHRIRKVDAVTGIITTVAGNGEIGFGGDGGPATEAEINGPTSVFVDNEGNIFIADNIGKRIRKVDGMSGIITTVAGGDGLLPGFGDEGEGGPATLAALNHPEAVFLDNLGNMFFSDSVTNRVRKVDVNTNNITTVAGSGPPGPLNGGFSGDDGPATEARLTAPLGLFVDSSGNIFIADTLNNRIRKVDGMTGIITTVAGNGNGEFGNDGVLATETSISVPSGVFLDNAGNIFIADTGGSRIRKVDSKTGIMTTVAGGEIPSDLSIGDGGPATDAFLSSPSNVFVDNSGNIFIADTNNFRIRKVDFSEDPGTIPSPTQQPVPSPSPSPTPDQTPPPSGKSFTFNCEHNLKSARLSGLEKLTLKLGESENCTLRLTNHEPGKKVEISSLLRKGLRSSIKVEPARSVTDANGELEITITAIRKGKDWAAWAVQNDRGLFRFNKKTYDAGLAWGMFVEVE